MIVQTVMVRRGVQVAKDISVKLLVYNIRLKKLRGSDEISADGKKWIRLDQHDQLQYFFRASPGESGGAGQATAASDGATPLNIENQMAELADMLREINQR